MMSLNNSVMLDASSDSSLNTSESSSKDKRRRSTFYVPLGENEQAAEEERASSPIHADKNQPPPFSRAKFKCSADYSSSSGSTTVVMVLPDGDDVGDSDDGDGDMEVKTVNGIDATNYRYQENYDYVLNNKRTGKLNDISSYKVNDSCQNGAKSYKMAATNAANNEGFVVKRQLERSGGKIDISNMADKYKNDRSVPNHQQQSDVCRNNKRQTDMPSQSDRLLLRKTPSMSSVEMTPQRKAVSANYSIAKSQSQVVTVRNANPIKMKLSVTKDAPMNNHQLTDRQKCKTLPVQQNLNVPSEKPQKLGLGFVRRAHSAKLTRSNSFLRALATKCAGPNHSKEDDFAGATVLPSEVTALSADLLREALSSGATRLLARSRSGIQHQDGLMTSDDDDALSDTSYEKACRRGSAPATPVLGGPGGGKQTPQEQPHTPSRIANFFSKRSFRSNPLKRTKSVTKLERGRRGLGGGPGSPSNSAHNTLEGPLRGGLRGSRSHESLLGGHAALSTIELGCGELSVAPVHSSVAGRRYCFEVRGGSRGPRYFCCASREERDLWMHSLRQSIQPSADQLPRTDNSLKLWLLEAKSLPPKRRYYCDVLLDGTVYARTAAKARGEILFWGELFDLTDLPTDVKELKVEVYREGDRKRKRDKQVLVGSVRIPVSELDCRYFTEHWYPVLSDRTANSNSTSGSLSRGGGNREGPTLRLKARYQSTRVRPLADYDHFTGYLRENYKLVCESLEPVIGVKAKEDIASALVLLMQSLGQAGPFLADVVALDLLRVGDQRLTFRGNSLATKAMEAFLKLTGEQYLQETLSPPISAILASGRDCEVDPVKAGPHLTRNQSALREAVEGAWLAVRESHAGFPPQIRECFAMFRKRLAQLNRQDMADNLISASIFLRFLCPAILSPSLFNITNEYPDDRAARNLTLVAKTLQTLANFTKFQGKEGFMEFLNDFLLREAPNMKEFLHRISTPLSAEQVANIPWSGHIDRGKQLSLLQSLLIESLPKVPPNKQQDLQELKMILDNLVNRPETQQNNCRNSMINADNIFRFNDPTVQNSIPLSNVTINEAKKQKSPTTTAIITNGVQNNVITSSTNIENQITEENTGNKTPTNIRNNKMTSYNTTTHLKKSPNLGVRAATLPRNTFGNQISSVEITNDENETNLIPIGLETSSAFVRKSPTPKHSQKLRTNGSQMSLSNDRYLNYENDRVNCNIKATANLDELSDLFAYADEQNVELTNNHTNNVIHHVNGNNKGSNMSIGQLSNVCSSGYQSITTQSQSSSPTDLVNPVKMKMKVDKKLEDANQNGVARNMALAFENPVYHMDFNNRKVIKAKKIDEINSLSPSSSEENLNRNFITEGVIENGYINSPLDTPSPIIRRNMRMPRTNPSLSYRNQKNDYRLSDEKRIDEHRYEIDRNIKDLAGLENDQQSFVSSKFKRSNQHIDKLNSDYGYLNFVDKNGGGHQYNDKYSTNSEYDYQHRNYDKNHLTIGIPLQHSHSNNSLYYPNSNMLTHSYSNSSLQHRTHDSLGGKHNHMTSSTQEQNGGDYGYGGQNGDGIYQSDIVHLSGSLQKKLGRRISVESACVSDSSSESELHRSEISSNRSTRTVEQCEMEINRLQRTIDRLQAKLQRSGKNGHQPYTVSDDNKMKSIIARMLSVEEERKREQLKMSLALSHKQRVIDAQGQQIAALDAANSRLLSALSSLRHRGGGEPQQPPQQQQHAILDNDENA